jgi:hypothetical protein
MIQMRKPITCQTVLPFEKLESWAWLGSAELQPESICACC